MKVYISGKTSYPPTSKDATRVKELETLLRLLGFELINPTSGGNEKVSLESQIVGGINRLAQCDVVFMLSDWRESKASRIEYNVAKEMGKDFLYESAFPDFAQNLNLVKIQDAIHEATGLRFEQYSQKTRTREYVSARMIFVHHCMRIGLNVYKTARLVRRDRATVIHALKRYEDDIRFDKTFKEQAEKVNDILKGVYAD
jgi:hypothetical protein